MSTRPVPPLRVQKGGAAASPNKMPMVTNRPLSELSPMAIRRNSPSFPQGKVNLFKSDSSPIVSSPFSTTIKSSPHLFWQGRDPNSPARENRNPYETMPAQSPAKRSSIENLKKASRVKNSSMFALEQTNHYDPSRPAILDGRPSSSGIHSPNLGYRGSEAVRKENIAPLSSFTEKLQSAEDEDSFMAANGIAPLSPSKMNVSPGKSSLSKRTGAAFRNGFDPETGIWEDDDGQEKRLPEGRGLHRHAKSVTFDQAPPQINEYEMTTPVPSSVASGSREGSYESGDDDEDLSFERGSSMDHDDSFDASLEDTDKTPVVLPEDWRFMSPNNANTELAEHEEDVFEDDIGSPAPTAHPGTLAYRDHQTSVNSVDSNGHPRPLPPLPSALSPQLHHSPGRDSLSGTIERISIAQRSLPSPPPAAMISKSDIRRMSGGGLSMEDRIRLMMIQEQSQSKTNSEIQRERRMRRADSKESSPIRGASQESAFSANGEPGPEVVEDAPAPRISRESILRHMRSSEFQDYDEDGEYDPDVPIPSLEDPTQNFKDCVAVKEEETDESDLYSIPDLYSKQRDVAAGADDDYASQYSQLSLAQLPVISTEDGQDTPRAQSPAREPEKKKLPQDRLSLPEFMDFGDESSFNLGLETYMTPPSDNDGSKELSLAPAKEVRELPDLAALRSSIQRPFTPEEQLQPPQPLWEAGSLSEEPGTPDSVIRHSMSSSASPLPEISETEATVKAPGSELNTRPSLTKVETEVIQTSNESEQSELDTEQSIVESDKSNSNSASETDDKRVSGLVQLDILGGQSDEGLGFGLEKEFDRVVEAQKVAFELSLQRLYYPFIGRFPSGELPGSKDSRIQNPLRNIPPLPKPRGARAFPGEHRGHGEFPLSPEYFANRSAHRQRGYLMRQNTKVVVASERTSHDEPGAAATDSTLNVPEANQVQSSPRKISQPTWTAEPWNGKSRRKSIRIGGEKSPVKRKPVDGVAPPLPGQASNVQEGLGAVAEDEMAEDETEDFEEGAERGRLFVKVVGVKDLRLPFPQNERTQFALTLDNGLHCVTTAWLDLARSAPIGQEFELVVLNELEFQLTLQMKLEEPKLERPQSPSKPPTSPKKQGAFGRLFGSPKKKKELDLKAHLEAQEANRRPATPPSAYELVQGLVAKDGSFARAYVSLNDHEKKAYGRPYQVDVSCFNEWAMEEVNIGSSRSKKSVIQLQRRPPYEIGKLELQLLYVPKPKGAKDEDMPKSMNGAVRAMREAEERQQIQGTLKEFEGHLSQQGGDCPYWRRRFFKLRGVKLTAYHESTLQPRATINLAKATKLIDDKSALTQRETSTKGGGRRKSAFAEEEEGYMFVEEGFRIRFANGEVIDFYADSAAHKDEWMKVLSQVVGKNVVNPTALGKGWTEMVLKREKSLDKKAKAAQAQIPARKSSKEHQQHSPSKAASYLAPPTPMAGSSIPLPTRPTPQPRASAGHSRTESYKPETGNGSKSQANSPARAKVSRDERQRKTKSMLI